MAFLARFQYFNKRSDLEQAISKPREARYLSPGAYTSLHDPHPKHPDKRSDLERAISKLRNPVDFAPDGLPDILTYLHNLGKAFLTRFERLGQPSDLEALVAQGCF